MTKGKEIICQPPEKHAFASPSKLSAIMECPYVARNCEGWEDTPSVYAERGRLLHAAIYDEETRSLLKEADRELVMKMRKIYIEPYLEAGMTVYHEVYVEIKDETGKLITFGTIDLVIESVDKKHLMEIDLKYGNVPVESADRNRQLKAYFVGSMQKFPEAIDAHVCIAQPSCGQDDEELTLYTRDDDYKCLFKEVCDIVEMAEKAKPEDARPNEVSCKWCRKDNCPAYKKLMNKVCEEYQLELVKDTELQAMPSAMLVEFVDSRKLGLEILKDVIKTQEAFINEVIIKAGGSANYRVQQGAQRRVTDWKAVALECGIPQEVIERHTTLSLSAPSVRRKQRRL